MKIQRIMHISENELVFNVRSQKEKHNFGSLNHNLTDDLKRINEKFALKKKKTSKIKCSEVIYLNRFSIEELFLIGKKI